MTNQENEDLLMAVIKAAWCAGREMMKIYKTDFRVEMKKNMTPLTEADRMSNQIIFEHIEKFGFPVISEEGKEWSYEERKGWEYFWLVDPLDGTKEFVSGNGEFTVNIALIKKDVPILGVVYAPVPDVLYFAAESKGSFRLMDCSVLTHAVSLESFFTQSEPLPCSLKKDKFVIIASRSHMNQETTELINDLKGQHPGAETTSKGSSLKLCMIAEGLADIYPRLGTTMEWDIAAGHALIRFSGGKINIAGKNEELKYNKPDLRNPYFIASR